MSHPPERSADRDAAILAMLPHVEAEGWTIAALTRAAGPDADLLFPGGTLDMIEAYCDLGDRWMEAEAEAQNVRALRLTARVKAIVALRLEQNRPYKEAVRRALAVLSTPGHARLAARCTARTVGAIWYAAGDASSDFSWYSKRLILSAVYGATLLYWLQDSSLDDAPTLAFLDRRLAGVGRIGKARRRVEGLVKRLRPARFAPPGPSDAPQPDGAASR